MTATVTLTADAHTAAGDGSTGDEGRLIVYGQDCPGVVAGVSAALAGAGANIVSLDQHSTDPAGGRFFQRTVFRVPHLAVVRPELEAVLAERIGVGLGLHWRLVEAARPKRVAIFASKTDHCLLDLLWRQRRGELNMSVAMVVSNHSDLAEEVRVFDVPYFHVPVINGDKKAAEQEHLRLLRSNVDLIILARYMQIISADFIGEVGVPIINIHHSFLPAFVGAGPYQKAKDRGVKLVGATAHYVTDADTVRDLMRRGADVERMVLARAVGWHCDDRVLRDGNSTIVFAS
jgi:formyltetrahydrofolate deformylase